MLKLILKKPENSEKRKQKNLKIDIGVYGVGCILFGLSGNQNGLYDENRHWGVWVKKV